eukprot:4067651-Amphidinium_carterae.1
MDSNAIQVRKPSATEYSTTGENILHKYGEWFIAISYPAGLGLSAFGSYKLPSMFYSYYIRLINQGLSKHEFEMRCVTGSEIQEPSRVSEALTI